MAKSIPFEGTGTADSPTRSHVGTLHAKFFEDHSVSCWQLSPDELAEVQRTGVIWVRTDLIEGREEGKRLQPAIGVTSSKDLALNESGLS